MKRITKQLVYAILFISILTQCDSVSSSSDERELKSSEHTTSTNATDQSQVTLISPVDAADKVSTNLRFTWNAFSGASEYTYQLSDNSSFSSVLKEKTISGTSYIPETLQKRKKYYWRVKVAGDDTGETWSNTQSFTTGTDDTMPETSSVVTLIAPVNNADKVSTNLRFTWNAFPGTSEYTYQLSDNSSFSSVLKEKTVSGTSFIPETLQKRKKYYWRVKDAGDDTGNTWSITQSFTTGTDDSMPEDTDSSEPETSTEVTLIAPVNNADKVSTNLRFTWNAFPGTSEYTYQLSDNSSFSSVLKEKTVSGTSYIPETLQKRKKYYWRVKDAGDDTGNTWSNTRSFTTGTDDSMPEDTDDPEPETPSEVTLIAPVNNADKVSTDLKFTWNALSGTSEYTYQLTDNSSFSSVITEETVTGTSYTPAGLLQQKKYYWRVKDARDTSGEYWSEVWSFTTGTDDSDPSDPETPTTVTLISPADNAFDLSINPGFEWEEVSGASSYDFQLADNSTFSPLSAESVEFGTTYQSSNLNYQTQYYWRVRVSGDSNEWSKTRSFTTTSEPVSPPPPASGSFVQVQNSNFVVDGNVMHFAGTNAYYLPNYEKLNPAVVDRALNLFEDTGITVIRMWGFYDGYDCGYSKNDSNENVIQTAPGEYSESALRDLDNVIAKGKERGIKFIIPFINFWDELGGVCQYNTWAGASNPSTNMEFFLNNSDTQKWYKDYIKMLLNRVNTVTGVAYKNEPAIAAWQIMNEGRNPGKSATILRDWYQDMAQYIKSIDPNHLVSTGEEGFDEGTPSEYSAGEYSNTYTLRANEGTSYVLNTAIPEIDFGNAHWYPSEYGFGSTMTNDLLRAQKAWLSDHKKIAESHGKPFIIGEYGFPGWADDRVSTMYSALYEHAESIRLDGNQLWQLTADGTKCWEFGGNICYPGGRADNGLYSDFKNHVTFLNNL